MKTESIPPALADLLAQFSPSARKHRYHKENFSVGRCWVAANEFGDLAEASGIEWEWVEFEVDDHPFYAGRPKSGAYKQHTVSVCYLNGQALLVDWTASQYGYSEFPLVLDWNEDAPAVDRSGSRDVSDEWVYSAMNRMAEVS